MDYSKTVNLPSTDFPMRGNLPNKEPGIAKKWDNENIYKKILESRKGCEQFILHDGPPYANGHLHLGHALNKILKDVIIKHKTMMGFQAPYVPGWDCHGLPIELQVSKKLGNKAREMDKVELRGQCREYAEKFIGIQMEEFKRLGVLGDYENPYKTMSPEYEARIVEVFGEILAGGYIYKSKKPIYWCPTCVTALAEAEVEYDNHTSSAIYVKFPVVAKPEGLNVGENFHVVIWTTTPWTIPANLAVCFHPDFEYGIYKFGEESLLLAKGLVEQFEDATGLKHDSVVEISNDMIGELKVMHPFIERESKVIFGNHVTLEQGTGVVHTAPGHGHEDYIVGLNNGLEIFCPVDDYGRYTDEFADMKGVKVFDANEQVVNILKDSEALIHEGKIDHSYPHCWRCKKPLIYRATEQWFFGMDHNDLRKKGLEEVEKKQWVPAWGKARFLGMVETRPDWCLSRQRSWGVPIPSFHCGSCGKNLMSADSVSHFAEIARKEGLDQWYARDIKDLIPRGTKCECGSESFVKEFDILDVWFDSGVSSFAVLDQWEDLRWPADMYLEGSDQHRGWFQSSFWPGMALRNRAPYNTVLTHGFLLDEKGKAMSKSLGNVIAPEKIINQFGADILRLWVSSEDYRNDVRIGMNMINQVADSYRRVRNTFKFLIGNVFDFSESDYVPYEELSDVDKWILHKLYKLSESIISHYENFEFHLVYRKIINFCAVELSSIYFHVSKDILYIESKDSKLRKANLTVLREINETLLRLISPILAFTGEEIWDFLGRENSVHMERYYELNEKYDNEGVHDRVEQVAEIKKDILKALEGMIKSKTIRSSLEAEVSLFIKSDRVREILEDMGSDLRRFFQVAKVTLCEDDSGLTAYNSCSLAAEKSQGHKCSRCWNFFDELGGDPEHEELCSRCTNIVKEMQVD